MEICWVGFNNLTDWFFYAIIQNYTEMQSKALDPHYKNELFNCFKPIDSIMTQEAKQKPTPLPIKY